ncbi:MAG: DUF3365 domain-containing protein [Planctomycetaceae bacterium]
MKISVKAFWLCVIAITIGCQSEPPAASNTDAPKPQTVEATPVNVSDSRSRALAAKDALFDKLSTRLVQAMSNGGPAAAIEVCSKDAARLAADVSEEHGVQIGRTSFKLRNPQNTPPDWAGQMVEERVSEPTFIDLPDGHLGALLPIKLMPQCMACHGPKEQIAEDVQTALAALYPDDQATGFNVDELRGWFWVDVPQ